MGQQNRVTLEADDWIARTPKETLAKNFHVNASVFDNTPDDAVILNGTLSTAAGPYDDTRISASAPSNTTRSDQTSRNDTAPSAPGTSGDDNATPPRDSFVYRTFEHAPEPVPGGGGTFRRIDSTTFPVSRTIASTLMTLEPGGLRELHWHPNVSRHPRSFVSFAIEWKAASCVMCVCLCVFVCVCVYVRM